MTALNPIIILCIFMALLITTAVIGIMIYKILCAQMLKNNSLVVSNQELQINSIVKPLKESLDKFETHIQEMEKTRAGAYAGLSEQVKSLLDTQHYLRKETSNLVSALKKPQVRGRWGEIQLQRVVELAGMLENCDFYQQLSVQNSHNFDSFSFLRPDLIVKLPGNKNIIVDAKVPLSSFLEALEVQDELAQKQKLLDHARHIREHIRKLSQKNYWEQFTPTPEFVILFLPGESFFSAALEADPILIEHGVEKQVIIATPTTLITLLKSVAYSWRQENLADNAARISELGKELSKRLTLFRENFIAVGEKLEKTVESYNKLIGTFESRILVTARKFQHLSDGKESPLELISPVSLSPRKCQLEDEKI
jgi:DNA recombination protein RmuC